MRSNRRTTTEGGFLSRKLLIIVVVVCFLSVSYLIWRRPSPSPAGGAYTGTGHNSYGTQRYYRGTTRGVRRYGGSALGTAARTTAYAAHKGKGFFSGLFGGGKSKSTGKSGSSRSSGGFGSSSRGRSSGG
jgi:hypothetical protein